MFGIRHELEAKINLAFICYNERMSYKQVKKYEQKNPKKAKIIKKAINRGLKQYEETFRRLAAA